MGATQRTEYAAPRNGTRGWPAGRRTDTLRPGMDLVPLIRDPALVRQHLLAPLAYRQGRAEYKRDYIAAALHAERRQAFLDEAVAALGDIPAMRLKGIAYAGAIYDDPALRPMTDIDLLVPAPRFAAAVQALEAIGYRDDGKRNQRSPVNHAVTLRRQESAIDLHRSMVQVGRMAIDLAAVWREAIPAPGGTLRPRPAHEYLIHVAHLARHEFSAALIAYEDAARLAAAAGDVRELARRWHLGRAEALVRRYVRSFERLEIITPYPFPGTRELVLGAPVPRPLQLLRKLAIHDRPTDLLGFAWGGLRTRLGV